MRRLLFFLHARPRVPNRMGIRSIAVLLALALGVGAAPGTGFDAAQADTTRVGAQHPVIVIDPGHNGRNAAHPKEINRLVDIGTRKKACNTVGTSTNDGLSEAEYNWDLALRVRRELERRGARVVFSRPDNTGWGPCITERAAIANRENAAALVSIHADGGPPGGRGFFLITPRLVNGLTDTTAGPSRRLAESVRTAITANNVMPASTYFGTKGLATSDQYGTLNLAKVPTAILETGNMRNSTDSKLMRSETWRDRMAEAIATGILAFTA